MITTHVAILEMKSFIPHIICSSLLASSLVYGFTSEAEQKSMTPDSVIAQLKEGNKRYLAGNPTAINIAESVKKGSKGQYPKAIILSCIDSRVPVEMVFDQGIGDIFVGRVAGNIETIEQLASMEYATQVAGSKLVVVLGHTSCGAVKGACDHVQLGNISHLMAEISPAVTSVEGFEEKDKSSKNSKFVDKVVEENVRKTVEDIRKRSDLLKNLEAKGAIKIVGAVYDTQTGVVTFL